MPVSNQALLSQIHLSGESRCFKFQPHPLKPNICTACNKLINKHSADSIANDECVLKALEYSQEKEKVPTCVIEAAAGKGALYHGGFKAVMNVKFLQKESIKHVVNTARGLEVFGPKYTAAVEQVKTELSCTFLELDWDDSQQFDIPDDDLVKCVQFVHAAISKGHSVLVHCAQGKSRSAVAVIAYVMASQGVTFEEAAELVKEKRKMAEPNPSFAMKLKRFQKSEALRTLRAEMKA